MAGQYKTRCPHCGAQFKISDEHLGQAQGAVRCGSCLQIFQATDHLVGEPPAVEQAATPPQWQYALDMDPEADRQTPAHAGGVAPAGLELSDSFLSLDQDQPDHAPGLEGQQDALGGNADESWAEALLEDLEDQAEPVSTAPPPAATAASAPRAPARHDDSFDFLNASPPRHAFEPADSNPGGGRRGVGQVLKWLPLVILALLVLAGQYAWFHFDTLARSPQWRPLYAQACEVIGCQLPLQSDLRYLRGANLVVRSHPHYDNALVVDALLFNEGRWPQPFPVLELTFSDLEGEPVASRRFQPVEYLRGELGELRQLPVQTPVHVALEIVDPGSRAVSYHLRLLPAPASSSRLSLAR
ncbi:hypothetical protein CEK62_21130 (plasmid) [Alcanivorax sp. N3-2A]|nr:hypothetical protein CEK62_00935 [Alcanivorax sp. N3-2A]ASK36863.1 hypothetical protein CEK62_21130 [Alcanivorax sp. N3-2A]|tara:strand:- start:50191 stop:51258 length:1068 start_codon:yes stop_codon:yes gene_type:complete